MRAIVNATSPEAIYSLLRDAMEQDRTELAVRIGYWDQNGQEQVEEAVAHLREDRGMDEAEPWPLIRYYPEGGPVGLIEFQLDPEFAEEEPELPAEESPERT